MKSFTIGVAGNPNCGKTTLFNALTGARQRVGNWPGVTVERKTGSYKHHNDEVQLVDLPGIYSLTASSVDEEVARDYIVARGADLIVNIVDASNIERNLYLTSQMLEMQVPMLIALNMMDVARDKQITIDIDGLAEKLGVPVVPIVASKNEGVESLKRAIDLAVREKKTPKVRVRYPEPFSRAMEELLPLIDLEAAAYMFDSSWLAAKLLEGDKETMKMVDRSVHEPLTRLRQRLEEELDEEADIVVASSHYGFIAELTSDTVRKASEVTTDISDRIDDVVLSRVWGIPIFLVAMYLMFMFTINLGGAFIDFFDGLAGAVFVDGFGALLGKAGAPLWVTTILAGGIGGGIQTMATFIPPIGFMFLFLSYLEDSGYMARAAFVMDRAMRVIGLPGKSFVPMLVGFGCNVPAIMATRTLENERDRTLTIMMNPFMSCGARLPVYALFAAAFFPTGGQNLVFLLYLIGIGFAVLTGLILKSTLLKGEVTPFVMELPPYHLPTVKSVLLRAWDRLTAFMFKAGQVLIPVIMVLSFLNSLGTDGSFGNEDSPNSVLAAMSKTITPALKPLGVTEENWPATVGIFTGIFAKEAVVGTLDSLYGQMDAAENGEAETGEPFRILPAIGAAFATIPANLAEVTGGLSNPLGLSVGNIATQEAAAEEQEVNVVIFGSMVSLFGSGVAAFAYLLFVLLYFPCSAAIAAVYRETNLKWTIFADTWTTLLAYMAATTFYQLATLGQHPAFSLAWITVEGLFFAGLLVLMARLGRKKESGRVILAGARV
ncbi:MAG: Fe(2+) transporter permease subunit FeoB [Thermodesulfobacteriota bacterium]